MPCMRLMLVLKSRKHTYMRRMRTYVPACGLAFALCGLASLACGFASYSCWRTSRDADLHPPHVDLDPRQLVCIRPMRTYIPGMLVCIRLMLAYIMAMILCIFHDRFLWDDDCDRRKKIVMSNMLILFNQRRFLPTRS